MFNRWSLSLLLAVAIVFPVAGEQPARTESELRKAVEALEPRRSEIVRLKETAPDDYVKAMLVWIDDLANVGERYPSLSRGYGVRDRVVSELMKLADFTRTKLHSPARAISLYQRAEGHAAKERPELGAVGMHEQIADIYEFDLKDRAAAAATLRQLRDAVARMPRQSRADYAAWDGWRKKWLDAEIVFLENGRRFDGSLTVADLAAFQQQIFFGAGAATTNGEADVAFNIYNLPERLPAATRDKLLRLPGSRATFLRTWLYAARLESAADARTWIERNDPAGFWAASMLTLAAVTDRMIGKGAGDTKHDIGAMIVRSPSGQVTGMAFLAREYAKTHALPVLPTAHH